MCSVGRLCLTFCSVCPVTWEKKLLHSIKYMNRCILPQAKCIHVCKPPECKGIWKVVYAVHAANIGQQEYLVESRSSCSPGVSKSLGSNSCFNKLLWFQRIIPHFPARSPLGLVVKLNSSKWFLPPVHILPNLIRFRLKHMIFIQLLNL